MGKKKLISEEEKTRIALREKIEEDEEQKMQEKVLLVVTFCKKIMMKDPNYKVTNLAESHGIESYFIESHVTDFLKILASYFLNKKSEMYRTPIELAFKIVTIIEYYRTYLNKLNDLHKEIDGYFKKNVFVPRDERLLGESILYMHSINRVRHLKLNSYGALVGEDKLEFLAFP